MPDDTAPIQSPAKEIQNVYQLWLCCQSFDEEKWPVQKSCAYAYDDFSNGRRRKLCGPNVLPTSRGPGARHLRERAGLTCNTDRHKYPAPEKGDRPTTKKALSNGSNPSFPLRAKSVRMKSFFSRRNVRWKASYRSAGAKGNTQRSPKGKIALQVALLAALDGYITHVSGFVQKDRGEVLQVTASANLLTERLKKREIQGGALKVHGMPG